MGQHSLDEFKSPDEAEPAVESSPRSASDGGPDAPADGDRDSESSNREPRPADEPAGRAGDGHGDVPEPPTVTAAWDGDGTCSACGEPARRRFLEDGSFVCAACKDW